MKTLHALIGTALAVCATCSCLAQVTYNRTISGVALTSNGDGSQNLTIVFAVEATSAPVVKASEGVGGPLLDDVSTTASVLINGTAIANIPFSIQVDPGTIFGGPCGGACGSGLVNGMSAALLCIDGQCQSPPIKSNIPIPAMPGDEIMVILFPSPGALPDTNTSDDLRIINFDGNPVGWNRSIKNLQIVPAAGPVTEVPTYDVFFDVEYSTFGMLQTARLGVEPLLLINGIPQTNPAGGCNDWIAAPFDVCELCTLFLCGTASCGGQNIQLFCRIVENDFNLSGCGCVGEQSNSFPGVPLTPDDEVMVLLRPSPGALPELPGYDDDDTAEFPDGCLTCGGDVNGDGVVDPADLAALLGNWGLCFPI